VRRGPLHAGAACEGEAGAGGEAYAGLAAVETAPACLHEPIHVLDDFVPPGLPPSMSPSRPTGSEDDESSTSPHGSTGGVRGAGMSPRNRRAFHAMLAKLPDLSGVLSKTVLHTRCE
jgi:hypothetical protein